jgi:hypothetical protein
LATFAQAMRRTIAATPASHVETLAVSEPCGPRALWIGPKSMRAFGSARGRSAVSCRYVVVATIAAWSGITPGFSRARMPSQTQFRDWNASGEKKGPAIVRTGSQTSIGERSAPVKFFGATPTIV